MIVLTCPCCTGRVQTLSQLFSTFIITHPVFQSRLVSIPPSFTANKIHSHKTCRNHHCRAQQGRRQKAKIAFLSLCLHKISAELLCRKILQISAALFHRQGLSARNVHSSWRFIHHPSAESAGQALLPGQSDKSSPPRVGEGKQDDAHPHPATLAMFLCIQINPSGNQQRVKMSAARISKTIQTTIAAIFYPFSSLKKLGL